MQVSDFMQSPPRQIVTAHKDMTVKKAMDLLLNNRIGCLPVLGDDDDLVGLISEKDIFRAAFKHPDSFTERTVGELMTTELIVGVMEDDLDYIAGVMTNNRIRHVPIVDNQRLVGLLSVGDIVKSQLKKISTENRYLKQYIEGNYPG